MTHKEVMEKAVNILKNNLTKKEFAEFEEALDTDSQNEFLYIVARTNEVMNPHLYKMADHSGKEQKT